MILMEPRNREDQPRRVLGPPVDALRANLGAERARRPRGVAPRLARPAHLARHVDSLLGVTDAGHARPVLRGGPFRRARPLRRRRAARAGVDGRGRRRRRGRAGGTGRVGGGLAGGGRVRERAVLHGLAGAYSPSPRGIRGRNRRNGRAVTGRSRFLSGYRLAAKSPSLLCGIRSRRQTPDPPKGKDDWTRGRDGGRRDSSRGSCHAGRPSKKPSWASAESVSLAGGAAPRRSDADADHDADHGSGESAFTDKQNMGGLLWGSSSPWRPGWNPPLPAARFFVLGANHCPARGSQSSTSCMCRSFAPENCGFLPAPGPSLRASRLRRAFRRGPR